MLNKAQKYFKKSTLQENSSRVNISANNTRASARLAALKRPPSLRLSFHPRQIKLARDPTGLRHPNSVQKQEGTAVMKMRTVKPNLVGRDGLPFSRLSASKTPDFLRSPAISRHLHSSLAPFESVLIHPSAPSTHGLPLSASNCSFHPRISGKSTFYRFSPPRSPEPSINRAVFRT